MSKRGGVLEMNNILQTYQSSQGSQEKKPEKREREREREREKGRERNRERERKRKRESKREKEKRDCDVKRTNDIRPLLVSTVMSRSATCWSILSSPCSADGRDVGEEALECLPDTAHDDGGRAEEISEEHSESLRLLHTSVRLTNQSRIRKSFHS